MSKYSYEEKLEAVLRVTEKGTSMNARAKLTGVDSKEVLRWVARYKHFGTVGLLLKHGSYSGDFKVSVIEYMHNNHLSLFQTAVRFGIPTEVTVVKWERKDHKVSMKIIVAGNLRCVHNSMWF